MILLPLKSQAQERADEGHEALFDGGQHKLVSISNVTRAGNLSGFLAREFVNENASSNKLFYSHSSDMSQGRPVTNNENDIIERLHDGSPIYIYVAGKWARNWYSFFG
ncbi:unnamed protein product [Clavelina lepadiformis]|uniref:Uncharacterized protein n=1 Tax=Clavelina lepadiformis TaxID=159417 RepID=A0ABP0GVB0_CLALP